MTDHQATKVVTDYQATKVVTDHQATTESAHQVIPAQNHSFERARAGLNNSVMLISYGNAITLISMIDDDCIGPIFLNPIQLWHSPG